VTFITNTTFNEIEVEYNLTTTVILKLSLKNSVCGDVNLSGTMTKNVFKYIFT
jgi:hypothetical protein